MNIENLRKELEQGDTFTYKRLCEVLEEKTKGGNSKSKQLEDWNRYFEFEKNGTKIKILNIRDKELPDIDKMLGRSKYYNDLETIILYGLKEKGGSLRLSVSKALSFTNMVNQNYFLLNGNESAVSKLYKVDIDFLYAFKNLSRTKLKGIFKRTLDTMKNKALIRYNEVTIICEEKLISSTILENGEEIYETKRVFRKSTEEDDSFIVKIENEALKSVGCTDKKSCYIKGKWGEYIKIINKSLSEKSDILFYYSAYEINSNEEIVMRTITDIENENAKISLNGNISDTISSSKDKSISNTEMREHLVEMLINRETSVDLLSRFIDVKEEYENAKETYEMINYENITN